MCYERLTKLPLEDLVNLVGVLLPDEARAHLPTRPTRAELAVALVDVAKDSPPTAGALDWRLTDPVAEWLAYGARQYGRTRVVGFKDELKMSLPLYDAFVSLSMQLRRGEPSTSQGREERADFITRP